MDRAVDEGAQAVALCASDCPEVRAKLEELEKKNIPVATYNSDITGAPRLCYVGEDARHAGRVAGEIAAKFLRPGEPYLLAYAGPAYAGHKGRADGFLERLEELGLRREDCRVVFTHNDYAETYRAVRQALSEEAELRYIYMVTLSVPGCVDAIRAAGREGRVRVLAHDNGPDICRLLREGAVDFTIGQDLAYQSYQALTLLFRFLAGRQLGLRPVAAEVVTSFRCGGHGILLSTVLVPAAWKWQTSHLHNRSAQGRSGRPSRRSHTLYRTGSRCRVRSHSISRCPSARTASAHLHVFSSSSGPFLHPRPLKP